MTAKRLRQPAGQTRDRRAAAQAIGAAANLEQLKALPVSLSILDGSGTIVAVNNKWRDFGRRNGLRVPDAAVGCNYLDFCKPGDSESRQIANSLKALIAGRLDLLTLIYPCHSPRRQRWFSLIGLPLSGSKHGGVALLHIDLSRMLPPNALAQAPATPRKANGTIPRAARLAAIGGALEQSVAGALTRQLAAMFGGAGAAAAVDGKKSARSDHAILNGAKLSARQMEVLRLLGQGKTNKEIAATLFRSPHTIKLHVSAILKQLKLKSRTQAALLSSRLLKEG